MENDFPLLEAGIIGLPFFRQYERYSITPQYLILDNRKLPLYDDGEFVSGNTAQINRINVNEPDQEIFIKNDPNIPNGIYSIKSNQLTVPYHNYDRNPALIKVPKYEPIQTIKETHRIALTQERTTIAHRLADLKNKTRLQLIEERLGEKL